MTIELMLDEVSNDLLIEKGELVLSTSTMESLRQKIAITLNAWTGEWKLNINFGIPYRQSIFVKGATKASIDALFIAKINTFDEVISVLAFESSFDRINRKYEIVRLVVQTAQGTQVVFNEFKPDTVKYLESPISPIGNLC